MDGLVGVGGCVEIDKVDSRNGVVAHVAWNEGIVKGQLAMQSVSTYFGIIVGLCIVGVEIFRKFYDGSCDQF